MLTLQERERLAYISGDVASAALLAHREDVESDVIEGLKLDIEELETHIAELERAWRE